LKGGADARCRLLIEESVRRNIGDSLLLSGGLDTSILVHLASKESRPRCFTVSFEPGAAPDVFYAKSIAKRLGLEWTLVELKDTQLEERLVDVIRILATFDPMEVRNSVAVYHGMVAAQDAGCSKVMTGDGADELFAGYSFSFNLKPREMMRKLRALWRVMRFSSVPMAGSLGLEASLPYLDRRVVRWAEKLGPGDLVGARRGRKYGKLVLRRAFERVIGRRSAWRVKIPIEYGSGTTSLQNFYASKIRDEAMARRSREARLDDGVRIRDKEHLAYYEMYRTIFPPPREASSTDNRCPECAADLKSSSRFCTTCGAYPVRAVKAGSTADATLKPSAG